MISRLVLLCASALLFATGPSNACRADFLLGSIFLDVPINEILLDDFSETEFVGEVYLEEPSLWWMGTDFTGRFRARVNESVSHRELNGSLIFVVAYPVTSCGSHTHYKNNGVITGTFKKSGSAFIVRPKFHKWR